MFGLEVLEMLGLTCTDRSKSTPWYTRIPLQVGVGMAKYSLLLSPAYSGFATFILILPNHSASDSAFLVIMIPSPRYPSA
jgi:hypothetical protein